ncbi:MAG TPA: class I SAM-dependent methyltransferase [Humisphaera sp.]|jgi:ubiquinone/menaquinone biosynthesis C-methylase UbiE|nr:class I SAM-dependent methyltransferase [Humisphaera sp.]
MNSVTDQYRRVFNSEHYLAAFERFRRLTMTASAFWRGKFADALRSFDGELLTVVDVASGYGRFVPLFDKAFGSRRGRIFAIDSSPLMIHALQRRFQGRNDITIVQTEAQTWTPPTSAHLTFISEALHLFASPRQLFSRIKPYLAPGGTLMLRVSSHAQISSIEWLEDFGLLNRDKCRTLDVPSLIQMLNECGITDVSTHPVDESSWMPAADYRRMLAARSFSILGSLSSEEMEVGLRKVDRRIAGQKRIWRSSLMTAVIAKVKP